MNLGNTIGVGAGTSLRRLSRCIVTLALVVAGFVGWAEQAAAFAPAPDVLDADDPLVNDQPGASDDAGILNAGPSDEDLVLAAQKVATTVQEAPSIIFVVTRDQIRRRGYRTINEVLRTVPGFEGDRWEGNGWQQESFARGLPRTILVLLDGVNIVEPLRNQASLDRKIPLELVERVEVTSGPGGVLWGSNALLGIVNIVTKRPDDGGVQLLVGAGDGPGDRLQVKGAIGVSKRFSEDVGLFTHLNFYSTEGPELRLDAQKIIGSLPEPSDDTATLYLPRAVTVSTGERSWFFNFAGQLDIGPVALRWMLPVERDFRGIATGGADLRRDYLTGESTGTVSRSSDSIRSVSLTYSDRFSADTVGVVARLYAVQWLVEDRPFGVYPASPILLAQLGQTRDLRLSLESDLQLRPGAAFDIDVALSDTFTIIGGLELFADMSVGVVQKSWTQDTLGNCPQGFSYRPDDPYLACRIEDPLVEDVTRFTGGAFVSADFKPLPELALNAGLRLQASSQFEPALLWSGGAVFRAADDTHFKLFASSGLRPPGILSTNVLDTTASISFQANPDLKAETSTSFELEANTVLLRDAGSIRDLYLRANAAFTLMDNVIGRPGGQFQNSEAQEIVSAEGFARLRFDGGHELWANYTFTQVFDDSQPTGQVENFAAHIINLGGSVSFLDDRIELNGVLTFKSGSRDANRPAAVDPDDPSYAVACSDIAGTAHPLAGACGFPALADGIWVLPGSSISEELDPVLLLDLGVRFKKIWRDLSVSLYVHNVLDSRYYEADFFNDARVISRPQPKPGLSVFGQVSLGL